MAWLSTCDELGEVFNEVGWWLSPDGTLPDDTHSPSGLLKVENVARIPFHILMEFLGPEFNVAGGIGGFPAPGVAVPVASMNK